MYGRTGNAGRRIRRSSSSGYSCKHVLHSIFSIVELYSNIQQIYKFNGLYAQKSYISINFIRAICYYKGVSLRERPDYEDLPNDIMGTPLSDPFLSRIKLLSGPDGFTLYGKFGFDCFCCSELFHPIMEFRLRLIRARPIFYMISDNPNVRLGIVDCSLYFRRFALEDDHHKERMYMLAYTTIECNYLETLAKTHHSCRIKSVPQKKNIFNNAPLLRIDIAMSTFSGFIGSYTENPFWHQKFDLRQIRILRGGQPIVVFDATYNCRLYVTTMKAMNFQDDIPEFPLII